MQPKCATLKTRNSKNPWSTSPIVIRFPRLHGIGGRGDRAQTRREQLRDAVTGTQFNSPDGHIGDGAETVCAPHRRKDYSLSANKADTRRDGGCLNPPQRDCAAITRVACSLQGGTICLALWVLTGHDPDAPPGFLSFFFPDFCTKRKPPKWGLWCYWV